MKSSMESKSSTKPNPHAWPLIGQNVASVTGCSRNTAPAPPSTSCCKQGWKITLVGSRFTHAAESRYTPIKGEALAVADALDKARHFVLGCKKPHHRSRPQTTLKDIWRQIPRQHLQHQAEEPKRENPKIPLQNSSHTGCQKQGPRHPLKTPQVITTHP